MNKNRLKTIQEAVRNSISGQILAKDALKLALLAKEKLTELRGILAELTDDCNAAANLTSGGMVSDYIENKEMSKTFGKLKNQVKGSELHLVKDLDNKGYIDRTIEDLKKLSK